jgi:hypothetical protein
MELRELVRDQIWLAEYPVRLAGARFHARMTLARRSDGALIVHSPGPVDDAMRARIEAIGRVAVVVAPGNFHHLHVASCQRALLHRPSRTLLLVDLIEDFGDKTPGVNWMLKACWKLFRMWNAPGLAPEYRFGWRDGVEARVALEEIIAWDFERIVMAHGDLIEHDAKAAAQRAWRRHLSQATEGIQA